MKHTSKFFRLVILSGIFLVLFHAMSGQNEPATDTLQKTRVTLNSADSTLTKDSAHVAHTVYEALDIGSDRGIFILSADKMLQLRILGSVRANFNYTDQDLDDHQTFNPYEIPTTAIGTTPNFYAGVEQTRLGFEVTRRTRKQGDVFIRIEGDFKNNSVAFRIRHAYGQFRNLLVGQTWSLFANVSFQPAFVSMDGPVGGSGVRTPQIRYSRVINKKMVWHAGIEYAFEDRDIPDSLGTALQVIPDFTGRFTYRVEKVSFRVAVLFRTISGKTENSNISYQFGYGASFAGRVISGKNSEIFLGANAGKSITAYIDTWAGRGEDLTYDPENGKFSGLVSYSGYLAYNYDLPMNLSITLGLGASYIDNLDFQVEEAFNYSYNGLVNVFWVPVSGARLGIEYANGQRVDKGNQRGVANRISILLYYDF